MGELWEAQGQLWEALGELWEGLCKSWHEPIGVRGFVMFVGRYLKIWGRRERTKEEKRM